MKFQKNQKVTMTLPNGLKIEYWFVSQNEDGTIAKCATSSNGKYFTNIAMNLLSA